MSVAARLNSRITDLAVGRHLPYRTVRARLTLLYGGLFLLSGAALMAIAYALLINAGFVFTLSDTPPNATVGGTTAGLVHPGLLHVALPGYSAAGSKTQPSAGTMAHWRAVARCMHEHGVPGFPEPTSSLPASFAGFRAGSNRVFLSSARPRAGTGTSFISDRDGAILVFPSTLETQSPSFLKAGARCGFVNAGATQPTAQDGQRRTQVRQQLLIQSGIALAGMSLLSLGLGWLMAGRVLQPLADSYEAQRQFVANASHELRAPLTRMRALSEVALASSKADFDSLRNAHERVLASEQHLEQIIEALLALTRGQAGLERRERLDLAVLVSQAAAARRSELAGLGVEASLAPAPTDGDPRLIERLIANLIDNAIRHNTPGGQVHITTGTRDRHAFLAIANTGPSVPSDEVERLFQPFQRLTGRTGHTSGHGLGLSIVQAIAGAHRAELTARARPEGGLGIEVVFPPPSGARARITFASGWAQHLRLRAAFRHRAAGEDLP